MAADVFGTYLILAMGLFTVSSLIIGYFFLNNSVIGAARGSAYYSYSRIMEVISSSIKSDSSTATNLNLNSRYVIFSAYFTSENHIYYDIIDGLRVFMYGIPRDDTKLLNDIINSAQYSYSNEGLISTQKLKKCAGQPCICLAELDSELKLSPEYFKPLACADICFGEDTAKYLNLFNSYTGDDKTPKAKILYANQQMGTVRCKKCVDFIANQDNYELQDYGLYQVIVTPFNPNLNNTLNLAKLKEFSDSTKFSFIQNIVECKGFDEIIKDSGKQNLNYADSLMFIYGANNENKGVFVLMNPKESFLFKLFGLEQIDNNSQPPAVIRYLQTTNIRAEKAHTSGLI